jgi:serine O-acetyltransferase
MLRSLINDIRTIRARDPAMRSLLDAVTSYPGLHALWMHRINHRLWRWRLHWLARFLAHMTRWGTGIEIHPGARIGRRLFIDHGHGVVIGETAEVGDDCTIYHGVTLGGTSWQEGKRHPTLGHRVVVGAGAKILGPICIGDDARVGSNAVVVKDVSVGMTVVGIPARPINRSSASPEVPSDNGGFSAYAQPSNVPDPVAQALQETERRIASLDRELKNLQVALADLQVRSEGLLLPRSVDKVVE